MPRYARILNEKQIYHVMLRGNNKEKIFIDDEDKERITDTLKEKKKNDEFYLFAHCVMDNHIHLVIKEGKDPIALIMKRIGTSYAYYFNKKYNRIGHVFQDRYKSENIEDDGYLLSAIRYVHQNPVKPGLGTIDGYKWSSYREYFKESTWIEVDEILSIFSKDKKKALQAFLRFNNETSEEVFLDVGEDKEIDGDNAGEFINQYLRDKSLQLQDLKYIANKCVRNELITQLLEKSNLSKRAIALELGLNREVVRKAAAPKGKS